VESCTQKGYTEPAEDSMTKTYLVTGAAGFIGSHVADALLARGDRVVGLDNLNDYYDPARKEANLREIERAAPPGSFALVRGDVRDTALLDRLFAEHTFESVAHLAAMAGVRASVDDPHLYVDVNVVGTLNLLERARRHRPTRLVLASTSSVYGASERRPFTEDDPADRPLAPYPASKRAAEMLGHTYHHLHGVDVTALRFFTVYGPRGRPDMMAFKVLDAIDEGTRVPLYNGGRMHRDWTFVDDIARGVVLALDRPLGFEVLNLGRGEPVLLADFVAHLERLAGRDAPLDDTPMLAADVPYTFASIDKAKRLLGYDPRVSVEEGTARFYAWYRRAVRGA
jgi:UDP-glucuronate 4-epimerase